MKRLQVLGNHFTTAVSSSQSPYAARAQQYCAAPAVETAVQAKRLFEARANGVALTLSSLGRVPDLKSALSIQAELVSLSASTKGLGKHAGWKCGYTSVAGYTKNGLQEPMRGPLFDNFLCSSGSKFTVPAFQKDSGSVFNLEAEIGFFFKDTPVAKGEVFSKEEVWKAIDRIVCCLEVCALRIPGEKATVYEKIADFANNLGVVTGSFLDRDSAELPALNEVMIKLAVDGKVIAEGSGAKVLDHPLNSVVWLANHLRRNGDSLKAGQLVISGAACNGPIRPGQSATATFTKLGSCSVTLV